MKHIPSWMFFQKNTYTKCCPSAERKTSFWSRSLSTCGPNTKLRLAGHHPRNHAASGSPTQPFLCPSSGCKVQKQPQGTLKDKGRCHGAISWHLATLHSGKELARTSLHRVQKAGSEVQPGCRPQCGRCMYSWARHIRHFTTKFTGPTLSCEIGHWAAQNKSESIQSCYNFTTVPSCPYSTQAKG
jgi:hypothetical protein